MSLTSYKRRDLDRTRGCVKDAKLIVIATEDTYAEKQYFEEIFGRRFRRFQIKVLETLEGTSAPRHVLKRLKDYQKQHQLNWDDELWLVVDKDKWGDPQLSEVASEAYRTCFQLAVSNPCFEIWLYLHISDPPTSMQSISSQGMKAALRESLGSYNQKNLPIEQIEPLVDAAIRRASRLDTHSGCRWPNQLGTHVYKLVESIKSHIQREPEIS